MSAESKNSSNENKDRIDWSQIDWSQYDANILVNLKEDGYSSVRIETISANRKLYANSTDRQIDIINDVPWDEINWLNKDKDIQSIIHYRYRLNLRCSCIADARHYGKRGPDASEMAVKRNTKDSLHQGIPIEDIDFIKLRDNIAKRNEEISRFSPEAVADIYVRNNWQVLDREKLLSLPWHLSAFDVEQFWLIAFNFPISMNSIFYIYRDLLHEENLPLNLYMFKWSESIPSLQKSWFRNDFAIDGIELLNLSGSDLKKAEARNKQCIKDLKNRYQFKSHKTNRDLAIRADQSPHIYDWFRILPEQKLLQLSPIDDRAVLSSNRNDHLIQSLRNIDFNGMQKEMLRTAGVGDLSFVLDESIEAEERIAMAEKLNPHPHLLACIKGMVSSRCNIDTPFDMFESDLRNQQLMKKFSLEKVAKLRTKQKSPFPRFLISAVRSRQWVNIVGMGLEESRDLCREITGMEATNDDILELHFLYTFEAGVPLSRELASSVDKLPWEWMSFPWQNWKKDKLKISRLLPEENRGEFIDCFEGIKELFSSLINSKSSMVTTMLRQPWQCWDVDGRQSLSEAYEHFRYNREWEPTKRAMNWAMFSFRWDNVKYFSDTSNNIPRQADDY